MTRALSSLLALSLICSGCVRVDEATRTERGPLLRTFHRPQIVEGTLSGEARVDGSKLIITVMGRDTCRDLEIEEYAEERITERSAPAAGPALSMGSALTLAAVILYAVAPAFSTAPDTTRIDAAGYYGPSTATLVRGWSLVGLGVGLPALGVGVVSLLRSGVEVERLKTEQVIGQKDTPCNERPLAGALAFSNDDQLVFSKPTVEGVVSLETTDCPQPFSRLSFAGQDVAFDDDSRRLIDAFAACVAVDHLAPNLEQNQSIEQLRARASTLRECAVIRGALLDGARRAVDDELARRIGGTRLDAR